jgi:hypothetical protein
MALVAVVALAVSACGGSVNKAKPEPHATAWTVAKVQREYNSQLQDQIDIDKDDVFDAGMTVDTHCLLTEGNEGGVGTLKCHLDYSDGDASTVQIDVSKTGDWIAGSL